MKKLFFIVAIVALVICNFYFIESDKDISKISLNSIVNMAQAQTEEPEGDDYYQVQICYECEPLPGQTGAEYECFWLYGDPNNAQDCFYLACAYGLC